MGCYGKSNEGNLYTVTYMLSWRGYLSHLFEINCGLRILFVNFGIEIYVESPCIKHFYGKIIKILNHFSIIKGEQITTFLYIYIYILIGISYYLIYNYKRKEKCALFLFLIF